MRITSLWVLWFCFWSAAVSADTTLQAQQQQARQQQQALQSRINALQKEIEGAEASRGDASAALKEVESAISTADRRLAELQQRRQQVESHLQKLQRERAQQDLERERQQAELAAQLRAMHASGLSPWAALLSGDDPQAIQRELGYLSYVSKAQAEKVQALRKTLATLATLEADAQASKAELVQVEKDSTQQRDTLRQQQEERKKVLVQVESQLKQQRGQASTLENNSQRLTQLISGLDQEIARQAELRRLEAERRAKEAAERRAREEAERLARAEAARVAQAQAQALRQEQERAQQVAQQQREAEQARLREQEEAARIERLAHAPAVEAEPAPPPPRRGTASVAVEPTATRINPSVPASVAARTAAEAGKAPATTSVDTLSASDRAAVAVATPVEAPPARVAPTPIAPTREARSAPSAPVKEEPAGGFKGLTKGRSTLPVSGEVQGRFGSSNPEGGVWRGVVIRASEGTAVRSAGAGRVVFANWLNGFGNLIIVDHGRSVLSVYGYNQSLLKQVGDVVDEGETIARVGATGGQVEPGLYLEIRENGQPVNPRTWISM